jgi:hypothetical protein
VDEKNAGKAFFLVPGTSFSTLVMATSWPLEISAGLAQTGRRHMSYKDLVQRIADLDWAAAVPSDVVLLSRCTALEFAESLRLADKLYPNDERLKEMMEGELKTSNMVFEDYREKGDHWEFLDYFVKKKDLHPSRVGIETAMAEYTRELVDHFSETERAMTVFSREKELTSIFQKIVEAHDWDGIGFGFYKHYLESHISFDSGEGGHHYLTKHFPLHESVLERFYQARLKLYQALF